jgi:hypothetical protein
MKVSGNQRPTQAVERTDTALSRGPAARRVRRPSGRPRKRPSRMLQKLIAAGLAITGFVALWLALAGGPRNPSILAAIVRFLAATLLSKARAVAQSLRALVGKPVVVAVWGTALPASERPLVIASVTSFGAGLLIRLQNGVRAELLKVAQPQRASFKDGTLIVPEAAYVQWEGKRLARQAGHDALVLRSAA